MRSLALLALAGCYELPPPPMLPPHALSEAEPPGSTTAMLVLGAATNIAGSGLGVGLRIEHQHTDGTALGVEVSGGELSRGDIGAKGGSVSEPWRWLVGVRGYGRYTTGEHTAVSYGAGFSVLSTGLVTGIVNGGAQATGASDTADALGALGLALSVPLHNVKFTSTGETLPYFNVDGTPAVYLRFDVGVIAPGETSTSFDLGLAFGIPLGTFGIGDDRADGDFVMDASLATSHRWLPH